MLELAIGFAAQAHIGQLDKQKQPYILHVLRVICGCTTPDARIAAALHDILEDTDYNIPWYALGGEGGRIEQAVRALTKNEGESYREYIGRVKLNALAREVKVADLRDNLGRIGGLDAATQRRLRPKYLDALLSLEVRGVVTQAVPLERQK